MTKKTEDYFALQREGTWIDYLRTRLPYSFLKIREEGRGRDKRYVLSDPHLFAGNRADYHNYWKRGNVYYVVGKLTDVYNLSYLWHECRRLQAEKLRDIELFGVPYHYYFEMAAYDFYNSMQMEKLWAFAQQSHIDRERVVMTNISQAVELCLKAVKTHAEYRETGMFTFNAGHNLNEIYNSLPQQLRVEIETESRVFARQYSEFRTAVEKDVRQLLDYRFKRKLDISINRSQYKFDWARIAERIEKSTYTAIVNSNDPGATGSPDGNIGYIQEDWFGIAMKHLRDGTYHRYSPDEGRDEYSVDVIHRGLMLARFMYEHLFPVPLDEDHKRLPITAGLRVNGLDEWKEAENVLLQESDEQEK